MTNLKKIQIMKAYAAVLLFFLYIYKNFLITFTQFFGFESKVMEKYNLTSFENYIRTKNSYGVTSYFGTGNIDIFKARGDIEYDYFRIDDMFNKNLVSSIAPRFNPTPSNFLDYYRKSPAVRWNRHHKDRMKKRSFGWLASWSARDTQLMWHPRKYIRNRGLTKPTYTLDKSKNKSSRFLQYTKMARLKKQNKKPVKNYFGPLKSKSKVVLNKKFAENSVIRNTYVTSHRYSNYKNRNK